MNALALEHGQRVVPEHVEIPELKSLTDLLTLQWHGSFSGKTEKLRSGRLVGVPTFPRSKMERLRTLVALWQIYQLVQQPSFLEKLDSEGQALGLFVRVNLASGKLFSNSLEKLAGTKNELRVDFYNRINLPPDRTADQFDQIETLYGLRLETYLKYATKYSKEGITLSEAYSSLHSELKELRESVEVTTVLGRALTEILPDYQISGGNQALPLPGLINQTIKAWPKSFSFKAAEIRDLAKVLFAARLMKILDHAALKKLIAAAIGIFEPQNALETQAFGEMVRQFPDLREVLQGDFFRYLKARSAIKRQRLNSLFSALQASGVLTSSSECEQFLGAG